MSTYIPEQDFVRRLGPLGLTMRLRRIVDRMVSDARLLYRELGLDIEPNWHAVLLLVNEQPNIGIAEIARQLGIAHPSASVLVKQLEQRGYLRRKNDSADGRRQVLNLTPAAKKKLPELIQVWEAAEQAIQLAIDESGQDVIAAIDAYERSVAATSFRQRTKEILSTD